MTNGTMNRVVEIKPAGTFAPPADRVVLDADDRQRRRIVLTAEKGTKLLLDLPSPVTLHDGDLRTRIEEIVARRGES